MSGVRGTKQRAREDEELMAGAWSWAQESERENGTIVTIVLAATDREGVFWVVAREHYSREGMPRGLRRSARVSWPTSSYATLAGAVLAAVALMDAEPVQEQMAVR